MAEEGCSPRDRRGEESDTETRGGMAQAGAGAGEHLCSVTEILSLASHELDVVVPTCSREVEVRRSEVQRHPWLHSDSKPVWTT